MSFDLPPLEWNMTAVIDETQVGPEYFTELSARKKKFELEEIFEWEKKKK